MFAALAIGLAAAKWAAPPQETVLTLSPLAVRTPKLVTISFESTPPGAEVVVNATARGKTPLQVVFVQGDRTLLARVQKPGYDSADEPFTANVSQRMRFVLTPSSPIPTKPRTPGRMPVRSPPKPRRIRRIGENP